MHITNCDFRRILCDHCQEFVIFFQHQNECPNTQINCSACSITVLRKSIEVSWFALLLRWHIKTYYNHVMHGHFINKVKPLGSFQVFFENLRTSRFLQNCLVKMIFPNYTREIQIRFKIIEWSSRGVSSPMVVEINALEIC